MALILKLSYSAFKPPSSACCKTGRLAAAPAKTAAKLAQASPRISGAKGSIKGKSW